MFHTHRAESLSFASAYSQAIINSYTKNSQKVEIFFTVYVQDKTKSTVLQTEQ